MKNVSSLKSIKAESPKTPGGISKSLLTPCRRVGLSRNWKKGGTSPFISPLSGSVEVKQEPETRKRKHRDVENTKSPKKEDRSLNGTTEIDINTTPSRHVEVARRKKSKSSLSIESLEVDINGENENIVKEFGIHSVEQSNDNLITQDNLVTPVRSKTKSKKLSSSIDTTVDLTAYECNVEELKEKKKSFKESKMKQKSPENLAKECIVVLQKKIFKKENNYIKNECNIGANETVINVLKPVNIQTLDSDSDELPLSKLNKTATTEEKAGQPQHVDLDDDDFIDNNKIKKLEDKTTSTGSLKKVKVKKKNKEYLPPKPTETIEVCKPSSQSSIDDEDDFDFNQKKTILIRKSYDKVTKPLKAKSTGSVTQKDIDELRSRIEVKKKLLLAKAMTDDTQDLRDLIKKWQKGCQDALMELMDLMRSKFPDKQNMEYSEMLQMLKIPSLLVGYDADNECFNTPDDASIILSKFNI